MTQIIEVKDENKKSDLTARILMDLPEWFGDETGRQSYIKGVSDTLVFEARVDGVSVGMMSIEILNADTAEVYVMGILKEYHRQRIGSELLDAVKPRLKEMNLKLLMVKTLGESDDYEFYKRTRAFYKNEGFYSLVELEEIWGKDNPCLFMVQPL